MDVFHPRRASKVDVDTGVLAQLGKKQVLKRRFGFWSIFGFAVCELITWETVLALFSEGFTNGGPAGLVYGFIIAWSSTLSVYTVISELASMAPIAGGQYYWVYMLAPPRWKIFCSYIIGWLTSIAWIATVAIETLFAGTILQGLVILDYPDYDATSWQGTLFSYLTILVSIFINIVVPGTLPKIEIAVIFFHIAGFIAIVAVLWKYSTHSSAHFVFATSLNEGGWPTQGLSYCVGFMGNVATFVGADASVHMAEEVANAARNIPRAILSSMFINGAVGFVMMVTVLFCLGNVQSVLDTATGYPFIQVFYNSVQNLKGATTMGAVVLILTWCCAIGITTTASRMTWSFARDKGTPFSHILSKVDRRTKVPIIAVGMCCLCAALLQLINIGSYVAFNDIVSLTITGFYGSYFLPAAFLLYHRVKGNIAKRGSLPEENYEIVAPRPELSADLEKIPSDEINPNNDNPPSYDEKSGDKLGSQPGDHTVRRGSVNVAQARLEWGPWHLPGIFGIINNAYACVYMIFVIFWSVWPPATPVTASSMNYSVVVTGGVIIFSIVWYWIRGRKEYKGPLIDDEVARIMRVGSVVAV